MRGHQLLFFYSCKELLLRTQTAEQSKNGQTKASEESNLEELLSSESEDVVELLFGHVGALGGAHARTHHQMGQHHLLLGDLSDTLLHRVTSHETEDSEGRKAGRIVSISDGNTRHHVRASVTSFRIR